MTLQSDVVASALNQSGKDALRRIRDGLKLDDSVTDKYIFFLCATFFFETELQAHTWANDHYPEFERTELAPTILLRCANPLDYLPRLIERQLQGTLPA